PEFQAVYDNRKDTEHVLSGLALAYRTLGEKSNRKGDIAAGQKYLMQAQMNYQDALGMYQIDLATRKHMGGDLAQVLQEFAQFYKEQGKPEEADKTYLEALEIQGENLQGQRVDVDAFNSQVDNIVEFYRSQHDEAGLESLYQRVVDIKRKAFGDFDPEVFNSLSDLTRFYRDENEYDKAAPLYQKAIDMVQEAMNRAPDLKYDPNMIRILAENENNLGDTYRLRGDNPRAEEYYLSAVKREGAWERGKLADLYANLGDVQAKQDKNKEALASYEQASQRYSEEPNSNEKGVANSLNAMGEIYLKRGDFGKAEANFNKVNESINEGSAQAEKDEWARALINLAGIKYMLATKNPAEAQKYVTEAEELNSRALIISPTSRELSHRILETPLNALSGMGFDKGNSYGGELPYEQVLTLREAKIKAGDMTQAQSVEDIIRGLERIYLAHDNNEKLSALYKRALDLRIKIYNGTDNPTVYETYNALGKLHFQLKHYREAEANYRTALEIVERALGKDDPDRVVQSLINLAVVYIEQHQYTDAEPLYQHAKLNLEKAKRDASYEMVQVLEGYADVLQNTSRAQSAAALREAAQKIRTKRGAAEKKDL
ncbi:MAG: hypothetical protein QOD00_2106, partial [Blastocatellia bacterium]|nr:hypothetical protein [Blastocatellia bacterium]